jgi:structural maintenance of chromosomes protein 6
MCHKRLVAKFGESINFVTGHNGSRSLLRIGGKSAILTALTVALGAKASFTNRGNSLKTFLKEGTE